MFTNIIIIKLLQYRGILIFNEENNYFFSEISGIFFYSKNSSMFLSRGFPLLSTFWEVEIVFLVSDGAKYRILVFDLF